MFSGIPGDKMTGGQAGDGAPPDGHEFLRGGVPASRP
jgi:hypothetical protein